MTENKDILTIPQAAKYCSVGRTTMWRWAKSGLIRVWVTPGGHHRILKNDLESFLTKDKKSSPIADKYFPIKSILIVDDDPMILKVLSKALSEHKYRTEIALDGFEAGVKLMQFMPDLIILDLIMPKIDGFEVCEQMKNDPMTSHIKILVLTGYDTEENRKQIMKSGADDFVVKPVEMDTLLQHIKGLLGD